MTMTQFWHQVPGGTATSIRQLSEAITSTSHITLTGVGPRGEIRSPRSLLDPASKCDAATGAVSEMAYLPAPLPVLYDMWDRFRKPRIDGLGSFDLIHLTVPVTPPETNLALVATVHDVFPVTHPELFTPRGAALMARGIERIRDNAAKVLVWTKAVADECIAIGFNASQLEVAPAGVTPVTVTDDDVAAVRDKYGLRGRYVMFAGTLEPRKNLGLILEALVRLDDPSLSLVLAGPAGWDTGSVESGWAEMTDLPGPVVRVGFVPGEDLAALQKGAVAFCFPSLMEGFGLPVIEAMAAGAVVITSAVSATAEVAGDAALLVDPYSPDEMLAAIRTARDDDTAARELRAVGLARSREFTWSACADTVIGVYETLLA
ncbi:MAG: glycosyltransferase family 4 protein [Microthrixaceae bacterium]|nr:glycosyltransferase family 4 protein [Microthrixaceae bacterium]